MVRTKQEIEEEDYFAQKEKERRRIHESDRAYHADYSDKEQTEKLILAQEFTKEDRKVIIIDCCDICPFNGKCVAWKVLTGKQRVTLTIGVGVGKFILKKCPLPNFGTTEVFKGIQ